MKPRGQAGYNLVVLIMAITVMNILVAAMLPLWSQAIRREKEEELIFRGFQYAEAIRVFRQRYQRYPNRLEELMEVKPRCIRQLYKDPMTEDGKWGLIFQNDPRGNPLRPRGEGPPGLPPQVPPPGGPQTEGEPPPVDGEENTTPDGRPTFGPRKGEEVQIGPIIGVHSKSPKKSILIMFGRERYDEWRFTEDLVTPGRQAIEGNPAVGNPNPAALINLSTRWIGRPMRFINQHPGGPQDGTLPGENTPPTGSGFGGEPRPRAGRPAPGGAPSPDGPR